MLSNTTTSNRASTREATAVNLINTLNPGDKIRTDGYSQLTLTYLQWVAPNGVTNAISDLRMRLIRV